jgi:hypothetical protein
LLASGCFSRNSARHLSSDVCLLLPEQTTKLDVVQQLGSPQVKRQSDEGETWVYYQVKKSLAGRLPMAGKHLGSRDYEVVTVTFSGNTVHACVFRAMDEEEFRSLGLPKSE